MSHSPAGPRRAAARGWRTFALWGASLALVACGEAVAPLPEEGLPDDFRFSVGAFDQGSSSWELRGDTVVFQRIPPDFTTSGIDTVRRRPTAAEWEGFWTAAAQAGVRHWSGDYIAEGVVDGTGWSLRLAVGELRVEANGSNAYPDADGRESELEPTAAFETFRSAVEALAGPEP